MTPADKLNIMLALRKALQILESDQGESLEIPVRKKRVNKYREQIEMNYATGTWRKPAELKGQKRIKKTGKDVMIANPAPSPLNTL